MTRTLFSGILRCRSRSVVKALWTPVMLVILCAGLGGRAKGAGPAPLTSLDYHVSGTVLQVSPAVLSVPKNIPGSVAVNIVSGGSTNNAAVAQLASGAYIQAIIRGPAFPSPQRIVGQPNAPLLLPAIGLVGDYELDSIALVDATTGATRLEGSPSTVPVHVFDQLLISSVTSQPLTIDQIQQKGIAIDDSNFRAVEFNVSFVLNGQTIPVSFPVVSPTFSQSTELIPADEVQAKLVQAAQINQQIASTMVQLPPALQTANLNIQLQGINFQVTDPGPGQSLALPIPPIPALMVIPGNIGYLHQFFSVQLFTENGAPVGSGLTVGNLEATLQLPPGPDGIVSTNYNQPGDDPLRFARIGPNKTVEPTQPVVDPGPDGQLGTADDISVLQPGETGQAEFLVEGLQEGLAVMNINITGDLYGLAAGTVHITGQAAGSVLVRNPSFSITFTHPDTVRVGEPYQASITILNTGVTPANLVSVTLNKNSISGASLNTGQPETIQLGTILPGQSATATYNMVAQRTGQIQFSDLTTSDDSVSGQFRFTMGVDAQGVPLSPDTIAMPDYVNYLPSNLVYAANRVLGQALSIATAAQLPPGIVPVNNSIITRRVLDLAEAGQRVQYGDPLYRVLPDLLRDWQGGRVADDGFDSLVRTSDAGAAWRVALFQAMEGADNLNGTQRLLNRAADLAGLGQSFVIGSAGPGQLRLDYTGTTNDATLDVSTEPYAMDYAGTNGEWAVTSYQTNAVFTWTFTNAPASADMAVLIVGTNGQAQELRWQVANPPPTAIYRFALSSAPPSLQADTNGDGTVDLTLAAAQTQVNELPPTMIAVQQDLTVLAGRPPMPCSGPPYYNYGTVVAVVFSKPMTQDAAGQTNSYAVDGDNGADSVTVQPSGRVALLNLRKGISALIPRNIMVSGVTDVRGNPLVANPTPIQCYFPGTTNNFTGGVTITGRVLEGDGTPSVGVPVTLTMYDGAASPEGCQQWIRRVSQVITDSGGNFSFDYVMSGIPYSISASDTSSLPPGALQAVMESTVAGQPDANQLEQIISSMSNPNSLLALLNANSAAQAVVIVQGLDRAVFNDQVVLGSGREGQDVPVVLRFRGRGSVAGQVVASDGVTPVPNAAVNLYPDPSSMELGRGVFSDVNGLFQFPGIPLGVFSVQVATSDNRSATVLGLLETPGETTNIVVALPDTPVLHGEIRGEVFDSDNVTPIPNARIYLGHYSSGNNTVSQVIAEGTADSSGSYDITNVPIQSIDVVAATFDGTRLGARKGITPVASQATYVNVTLQAATTVFGQVQFDDGAPATNALVAGGLVLVRTDSHGNFQLQGVPVGTAIISAGLERNPAAGIDFPRLGSTSATIIPGAANYVVVKLRPAGRIYGRVYDAQGNPQPNIRVAIPAEGGFYWTDADTNGNYAFENLGLGGYTLSAPGNAVAPQLDTGALGQQLSSGDESQILDAFKEAVTVFVGSEDPLLNGDDLNFHPAAWGYTTASIPYDGADVNADIHFLPQGTITGTVLNGQGVPIGAAVELTGLGPDPTGAPVMTVRGIGSSDPATGQFGFTNVLLPGDWGLQAASPFYPAVTQTNGFTTEINPNASGIVLKFPPINDVNGRISGHVYLPDGTPVGQGAQVRINISADYQIETDTNGFFDTQTEFPAINVSYTVQAFDPVSGLVGQSVVTMTPGITNFVDVHLLTRNSTVTVTVLQATGSPAPGAQLELDQGSYPYEAPVFGVTDTNGVYSFTGLWEGMYAVMGQFTEASTKLSARGGVTVGANQTGTITLHMGATGSIQGTFVKSDLVTPVYGAEVSVGGLGFAATDTNGYFRFDGVPLGTYTVTSSDPVTGGNAQTTAAVNFNGQTQTVQLVEEALGTVNGLVLAPSGSGFVPNASVNIVFSDGLTPGRTVTSGPNGAFSFPGSPLGAFTLSANYAIPGALGLRVTGHATGTLSSTATNASVNIQLQPLTAVSVRVVRTDGITPAQNTLVTVGGQQEDTDTNGAALFTDLLVPATYGVTAISQAGGDIFDGAETNVVLSSRLTNSTVTLVLPGVGNVVGTVVGSDGITPVNEAQVTLAFQSALFAGQSDTALTDTNGHFAFSDVPIGAYLLTAANQSLGISQNGTINTANQTNVVTLQLGNSGTIIGIIVRADGVTPVGGVDVEIDYQSQSANAGRAVFFTGPDGNFEFDNVPLGSVHLTSAAPSFDGIINFTVALTTNGQVLNLGAVPFDETDPAVVQVMPADTTVGVPITNAVYLLFSKALATNTIDPSGILIQDTNGVIVDSTVTLMADTNGIERLVQIQPVAPLHSLETYAVIVLSGQLFGATGGVIGSGPTDLAGRTLAAPFESHFTTADNTPPNLLSIFPSNNAVQIDPSSVPRLTFDKPLNPAGFVFIVTGPSGPVAGTASLGINGQVMTFLPVANLQANAFYTMTISNVTDLAGNSAVGQPYIATFATLDTVGPTIVSLNIVSNAAPLAGATVPVVAVLASNEIGASVRFTQDFNSIGASTNAPYQIPVKLPASGSTTVRAIAVDQYGNEGQVAQLIIPVQPPAPPGVQFTLVSPTNTPIPNGATVVVNVTASGDIGISNLMAVVGGGATGTLVSTNGSSLQVRGTVPLTATPYVPVQVFASATDLLGFSSGQQVFDLPITDTVAPTLMILNPTNNGHLSAAPSFNLTTDVSDNSSNVTLEVVIGGSLVSTQSVALTLSPNTPFTNVLAVPLTAAPTNGGSITATVTATDAAGNSTSATRTFWLANTPGPGIASLIIASNIPPLAGFTVPIKAVLATNEPGVVVQFIQDSKLIGVATNAPYQVLATLPLSGSTTISAIASDQYGNVGATAQLTLTVQQNVQPSVHFTRVTPAAGPIPSGSAFEIDVNASGNSNVFNITGAIGGAASPASFATNGSTLRLFGSVPSTVTAGQQVQITGQAVDTIGQSTGPQLLTVPVSDGTPPALALLSPAANEQLSPGGTLTLTTQVSDNSTNVTLTAAIAGYLTTTQMVAVPLTPNVPAQSIINFSLPNEPTNGGPLTATLTATDGAGNSTTLSRVFWLPGTGTTVTWERQALGQTFPCTNGGTYSWPNNNNWSQSEQFGTVCNPSMLVEVAPSNWSTTNAPNADDLDVVLGALGGAPANLDISVAIHSLTIQTNGGLNMSNGRSVSAVNYDFQGDGAITVSGSAPTLNLNGGTMEKSGGTNTFSIDPSITLNSSNGTFAVDSGTLALPGNGSTYSSGGAFNVAPNATLVLEPANQNITMAGTFTGSGSGSVLFDTGTLRSGVGGVTFDVPGFQWGGGTMVGIITNEGNLALTGATGDIVANQSQIMNGGRMVQQGSGGLGYNGSGGGLTLVRNLSGGVYQFASDSSVFANNCCGSLAFDNEGLVWKSGGTNTSSISVAFNNDGGRIQVDSGVLSLNAGGSSSGGTMAVAAGAVLDLTGGSSPAWQGLMTGSGAGEVLLGSGTLVGTPSLALNFAPGTFQWSGGTLEGSVTNAGSMTLSGTNDSVIANQSHLYNAGQVLHAGTGRLGFNGNGGGFTSFENLTTGVYQFLTDSSIYENNCCGDLAFDNQGLLWKSGGTGVTVITGISFNNLGGTIRVDSGQLDLPTGSSVNGTFAVAAGASVDLTSGASPTWAGFLTGSGAGAVFLSQGTVIATPSLTLDFTNGLFQWSGGVFAGVITNRGITTFTGTNNSIIANQARFFNAGRFLHEGTGGLGFDGNGGGVTTFNNLAGGIYEFFTDGSVYQNNCCGDLDFNNQGLLWKAGGTNASTISGISFNNVGGTIQVDSGSLVLAGGTSASGTFNVAAGAAVDLTGGNVPVWSGLMTGSGAGQVQLSRGQITASPNLTLDFTNNLFQWDGGTFAGVVTNAGIVNVSGTNDSIMANQSQFFNAGRVLHTGSGRLGLNGNGGGVTAFNNLAGGVYEFLTDSSIFQNNCCGNLDFNNQGLFWKGAGTNVSFVSGISFDNQGGTIRADSGQLNLAGGTSVGGTFIVATGAVVNITGGGVQTWSGTLTGSGAGAVAFAGGTISATPNLTLNFTNGLFQWSGGTFAGLLTNIGIVTVTGTNDSILANQSVFYNAGQILHEGSGRVGLNGSGGGFTSIENLPGGVYQFLNDSSVFENNCCGNLAFDNQGLLWKSGGTNTSSIATGITFNNEGGSIEVDSGVLSVSGAAYVQGGGAFTATLGGTNAGQFGQFAAGNVTLSGPLHVKLAGGFTAPVGTQFQIISATGLSGTFSTLDVPAGLQVIYAANGVFLTVTSQLGQRTVGPTLPILSIREGTANQATLQWGAGASNFILESATTLKPGAVWTPFTNLFVTPTNGTFNLTLPVSNSARFFRLRQP